MWTITKPTRNDAGDRHDDLLPNHCAPEGHNEIVGDNAPCHRGSVEADRRLQTLHAFHLFSFYFC